MTIMTMQIRMYYKYNTLTFQLQFCSMKIKKNRLNTLFEVFSDILIF